MVNGIEELVDSSLSKIDPQAWGRHGTSRRAWELYAGFLYGHPIWTRSDHYSIEEDFGHLVEIWYDGHWHRTDTDAADAAMDAMRQLIVQETDALTRPFNIIDNIIGSYDETEDSVQFLMDFMVYGQSGHVFGKWYDAFMDEGGADGLLEEGLAERYKKKAQARREGHGMLDLMERCKYHDHHAFPERPCYLDK
jgi:hypothetical protein